MASTNRGKESTGSSVGKEKRVPCWNCQSKKSSTADKAASGSGSEKQVPNYLKPTISSRLEPHQRSFQLRSDISTSKANLDRRRSFDRPPSLKQSSLSSSRLHKALVSPGPRPRTVSRRLSSSLISAKTSSSASTKPISKTTTVSDGKLPKKVSTSSNTNVKKTSTSSSSCRNKQQASSANSSTKAPKSNISAETTEKTPNVEEIDHHLHENIKKAQSHDSIVQENPELVSGGHDDHEPQTIKADNDEAIPRESEELKTDPDVEEEKEQEEETTEKAEEEKPTEISDIEHQVEENVNQEEEKSNDVVSQPLAPEGESVEVKENADEEENQHEIPPVDDENSHYDVKEELEDKQVTEEGDRNASEEVDVKGEGDDDDDQVENSVTEEGSKNDETSKNESTATATPKQVATNSGGKGKESPQAYNDVIEETKNKLMVARKNKVSALVGAFQTVIDCESSSK